VYSDRSLNHMSVKFQEVMKYINTTLKHVYHGKAAILVPGGGSFGMESVAAQFCNGQHCMVIRNGWFSYRWSDIFDKTQIPRSTTIMKARRATPGATEPFAPCPLEEVIAAIIRERPSVVCAPHVETSAGMIIPDSYIKAVSDAVHEVGGIFVLDCVASGCIWVDMEKVGADVLITAPQKGWSGTPCCGIIMLSDRGVERMNNTTSSAFGIDLKKWHTVMQAYENGGFAYHVTMPTDSLVHFAKIMKETEDYGFDRVFDEQVALGKMARELLESRGYKSVAAPGFEAPGVVVSYTSDPDIKSGKKFKEAGMQIAAGIPLELDEGSCYMSFRLGLFGLDKIHHPERTCENLRLVLDAPHFQRLTSRL
jgi:aspartate aminotransferase-like enzyme